MTYTTGVPLLPSPVGVSGNATNALLSLTLGGPSGTKTGTTEIEVLLLKLTGGTTPVVVLITGLNTTWYNDNGVQGQLSVAVPPGTVVPVEFARPLEGGPIITIAGTAGAGQTLGIFATGMFRG